MDELGSKRPLRRFLYLSPYFPPQTRVGALRPLKFSRHLPGCGWAPVVLADLRRGDSVDRRLSAALPATTIVHRDYSRHAQGAFARLHGGIAERGGEAGPGPGSLFARFERYAVGKPWYPRPEWLPLGAHSVDIPHALSAARRLLAVHPECRAIVVNADPYASLLVGARLARETGLPLVADLRDPWAPCALRRPLRPPPQLALVDRLERHVVDAAAAVVLNTETARRDYRAHYHDVDPQRFHCIRNHADAALVDHGVWPEREPFTMLFLGNLRRFVEGDALIELLAELSRRGVGPARLRLLIAGVITAEARAQASRRGVLEMIETHPHVPYVETGSFMRSVDLLVSLSHRTEQRIPAKIFDYLSSPRPVLLLADSAELRCMVAGVAGVSLVAPHDVGRAADVVENELARERRRDVGREATGLDSESASGRLAVLLDAVS